jgi:hypothetical protein
MTLVLDRETLNTSDIDLERVALKEDVLLDQFTAELDGSPRVISEDTINAIAVRALAAA